MQNQKAFIIAEAGVNHNGSVELAMDLIRAAAEAGADAVKFQTFKADKLVTRKAQKAEYQTKRTNKNETQYEMLKKLELDDTEYQELIQLCHGLGIEFLSTPFDTDSVNILTKKMNLERLKVSSGDITNAPLLLSIAQSGKNVILSTGMSTIGEVEMALAVLAFGYIRPKTTPSLSNFWEAYCSNEGQSILQEKVILLHCTTEYPTSFSDVNLKSMDTLKSAFNLKVGYSDHTLGISIPIAAVARGASVIEKHFTLDRDLPGPDHKASLESRELKHMVNSIREVELSLGRPTKLPTASEIKNQAVSRKSIVAARDIHKGEKFTEGNLTIKRPGNGISPANFWDLVGKVANKDYKMDELVRS